VWGERFGFPVSTPTPRIKIKEHWKPNKNRLRNPLCVYMCKPFGSTPVALVVPQVTVVVTQRWIDKIAYLLLAMAKRPNYKPQGSSKCCLNMYFITKWNIASKSVHYLLTHFQIALKNLEKSEKNSACRKLFSVFFKYHWQHYQHIWCFAILTLDSSIIQKQQQSAKATSLLFTDWLNSLP